MEKFLSFAIVKDNSEQYLLVRYADGTWNFPGSTVPPKKLPQDVAMKAVLELTDIACHIDQNSSRVVCKASKTFVYYFEAQKLYGAARVISDRITEVCWCNTDKAFKLLREVPPQWQ